MNEDGVKALLQVATSPTSLMALDLSHSFATEDFGSRYNWFTDATVPYLQQLVEQSSTLRYLDLGYSQMSQTSMNTIMQTIIDSNHNLLYFFCKAREEHVDIVRRYQNVKVGRKAAMLRRLITLRLSENVQALYGEDMSYDTWSAREKRFLTSPPDVRLIDSVHRNRDAGMARRGLKFLKKKWDNHDDTLKLVEMDTAAVSL